MNMEKGLENKNLEIDATVNNVFGGWNNLRSIVEDGIKNYKQHNKSAEIGKITFVKELMGNYAQTVTADEFKMCIRAVNIAIGQIEKKNAGSNKYKVKGYTDQEVVEEVNRFHEAEAMKGAYGHEKMLGGNRND